MRILQWFFDVLSVMGGAPRYDVMLELPVDESELATHTTQSLKTILASSGLLSRDKKRYLELMRQARKSRQRRETGDTQPIDRVS